MGKTFITVNAAQEIMAIQYGPDGSLPQAPVGSRNVVVPDAFMQQLANEHGKETLRIFKLNETGGQKQIEKGRLLPLDLDT